MQKRGKYNRTHRFLPCAGNPTYIRTEHLLANNVKHVFLIRNPKESIPSFYRLVTRADIGLGRFDHEQLGIRQSAELYRFMERELLTPPMVIDSDDLFDNAEAIVRKLCSLINIEYDPRMLSWPDDPAVIQLFSKCQGRLNQFILDV